MAFTTVFVQRALSRKRPIKQIIRVAGKIAMTNEPLILNVDYTIENGLYVFTAHYLQKRGYCCQSGCRNCPYGFRQAEDDEQRERGEPDES